MNRLSLTGGWVSSFCIFDVFSKDHSKASAQISQQYSTPLNICTSRIHIQMPVNVTVRSQRSTKGARVRLLTSARSKDQGYLS